MKWEGSGRGSVPQDVPELALQSRGRSCAPQAATPSGEADLPKSGITSNISRWLPKATVAVLGICLLRAMDFYTRVLLHCSPWLSWLQRQWIFPFILGPCDSWEPRGCGASVTGLCDLPLALSAWTATELGAALEISSMCWLYGAALCDLPAPRTETREESG